MWSWLWIGPSATAMIAGIARCVLARIRAESQRHALEIALEGATPRERVAIIRELRRDQPG